ncbi:MFS general substrate transporter [Cylindrobasidium torrendii FP15055 ss-10]|uniref:MFS general substrate transporter n=1 Tax=Cylindrobasidium torrendii FP15055 ss-10 TaxID=1314674 RepID=A0A0D7AYR9_9AGAR|nr:MFS general substrate transporter [Cylindrobasidium torrendii FP15055 ss-10]
MSRLESHGQQQSETAPLLGDAADDDVPSPAASVVVQSRGVTRMEAVSRAAQTNKSTLYAIGISVIVCAWAYSLDLTTTGHYNALVTSYFKQHSSGLATLSIAQSIIGAVCKPFIAKTSDITSRPYTYTVVLGFYVLGYTIAATAHTITAYIIGEVFVAVGSSGLDLINELIVADLTPLEWRGFIGSMLSVPFLINSWFSGKIVAAFSTGERWRWGYAMFAIIMPVCLGPAICTLIYLDNKAQKEGIVNVASSNAARRAARELAEREGLDAPRGAIVARAVKPTSTWTEALKHNLEEIDALGLLILGSGWALLLLPFALNTHAGGWENPIMKIMVALGVLLLAVYIYYEMHYARMPSAPRRLLTNRTFIAAVVIDAFYFVAGNLRGIYWSSYVFISQPWSVATWATYGNIGTITLCVFGITAGLIQRWTHRYKALQIFGLFIKIIGIAMLIDGGKAAIAPATIIISPILVGMGGAFSVVGSRVASQASVPHQDLALTISLLSLWSKVGAAIGSATASAIWSSRMPPLLRKHLPNLEEEKIQEIFNSIRAIREYDFDDPIRQGAIMAYRETLYHLFVPAVLLALIPFCAAFFQSNFYLGKQQNAVTNIAPDGSIVEPRREARRKRKTWKESLLSFWAGRP